MKNIFLTLLTSILLTATISAQPGGGFQRRTPEERTATIHVKLDSAFKLEPAKFATLDTALTILFKAQDTKRQEMMAGGMPDRETIMAEMKKFTDAREEILKAVLTEEQFGFWRDKIEPSMRPQRPSGSVNK